MVDVANGVPVAEDEVVEDGAREFLTCMACGVGFVLYRIADGRATVRGRDTHLDAFLEQHAGCGEEGVPPLEVLVE